MYNSRLPWWMWLGLNIANWSIYWYRQSNVQQWRGAGHGMIIVLVIDLQRRIAWLALPIADQLEGTRACPWFGTHLILEYVHVEVWSCWIFLRLPSQQCSQSRHIKLQHCAQGSRLLTVSIDKRVWNKLKNKLYWIRSSLTFAPVFHWARGSRDFVLA